MRAIRLALLLVLLLAAALRFSRLDAQSLWSDEGASVAQAGRDPATIIASAARDIHPPFYYLALRAWVVPFGTSEFGVRSLSAALGVCLVGLCYLLGKRAGGAYAGVLAAFLAALNPFQVYYAQEARMYMLASVLGAVCVIAAMRVVDGGTGARRALALYAIAAVLGLYTHYVFPVVPALCSLIWLGGWFRARDSRQLGLWLGAHVLIALAYLPWLPIALQQVTTWAPGAQTFSAAEAPLVVWRTLAAGPGAPRADLLTPLLFLVLAGAGVWYARRAAVALLLYLLSPIALMLALALFKDAFLKFLLVASPPFVALSACGVLALARALGRGGWRMASLAALLLLGVSLTQAQALNGYYFDPRAARDDYRSIAATISALARPGDAVILNAPGQEEIFRYYYHGDLPVYPLPRQRPAERAATEAELAQIAARHHRLFAVFWATDESDPQRVVESWLDARTFRADDAWYGNVRMAWFAVAPDGPVTPQAVDVQWSAGISLIGVGQPLTRLAAGEVLPLTLVWKAARSLDARYKVFVHLLDPRGFVVAQRDEEPAGGARPTTTWQAGETLTNTYGLFIPPGMPPLTYQVEIGWYALDGGRRLATTGGADRYLLAPVTVTASAPPRAIPGMALVQMGVLPNGLELLGYRLDKVGAEGQRDPAFAAGDGVHLTLFWRKPLAMSGDGAYTVQLGARSRRTPPIDGLYPPERWSPGEVVRDDQIILLPSDIAAGRHAVTVDGRLLTSIEVRGTQP